jgi:hypothetical protein
MQITLAIVLIVTALLFWATNLVGLPGNWLILALAIPYAYYTEGPTRLDIGWPIVVALVAMAAVGELVEFLASALGASKAGGSKRGAVLAMFGSLAGGVIGMFVGTAIPIPVVGSVIGALLCASLGALGGAYWGERWKGRDSDESFRVGHAAFWGRLLGTVGKVVLGIGMLALLSAALAF